MFSLYSLILSQSLPVRTSPVAFRAVLTDSEIGQRYSVVVRGSLPF